MPRRERWHQLNVELDAPGWALWQVVKSKFPDDYAQYRMIEAVFERFLDPESIPIMTIDFTEPEPEPTPQPNWHPARKSPGPRQIKLW